MSGDHETVDLIKSIRSRISLRAYLRSVDEYYRTHPIRRWLIPQVHHDVRRYLLDVLEALDTMNGAPICGDVSPFDPAMECVLEVNHEYMHMAASGTGWQTVGPMTSHLHDYEK